MFRVAPTKLQRAKRCFERAGLADPWDEAVRRVRANRQRKTDFPSDLAALTRQSQ